MGRLGSHPHIVTVFDLGEHEGQFYMVTKPMGRRRCARNHRGGDRLPASTGASQRRRQGGLPGAGVRPQSGSKITLGNDPKQTHVGVVQIEGSQCAPIQSLATPKQWRGPIPVVGHLALSQGPTSETHPTVSRTLS